MRRILVVAGALAFLASLAGLVPGREALAKRKGEGLRYAASWAEAVQEARSRGALLFATFHKDN